MAISTDDFIDKFGTQDTITTTGASTTDTSFTSAGTWTNDDDAPFAVFVMRCQWAVAPTDGSVIKLHARKLNIQSTDDDPVPDSANLWMQIASFVVNGTVIANTDTLLSTGWIALPNHYTSQQYEFYIENQTDQTINVNWDLYVTPVTKGPHA